MFVVFDFFCSHCKQITERFVRRSEMDVQKCCGKNMTRLPAGTRTTFKFADRSARK